VGGWAALSGSRGPATPAWHAVAPGSCQAGSSAWREGVGYSGHLAVTRPFPRPRAPRRAAGPAPLPLAPSNVVKQGMLVAALYSAQDALVRLNDEAEERVLADGGGGK
jgi:hypothetical protein